MWNRTRLSHSSVDPQGKRSLRTLGVSRPDLAYRRDLNIIRSNTKLIFERERTRKYHSKVIRKLRKCEIISTNSVANQNILYLHKNATEAEDVALLRLFSTSSLKLFIRIYLSRCHRTEHDLLMFLGHLEAGISRLNGYLIPKHT
jgi:hypothetical protein